MITVDTRGTTAYSPLIPAIKAMCNAVPGETLEIVPEPGRVEIQAVDDLGRSAVRNITVKLID